jgi:hypothetical protein
VAEDSGEAGEGKEGGLIGEGFEELVYLGRARAGGWISGMRGSRWMDGSIMIRQSVDYYNYCENEKGIDRR